MTPDSWTALSALVDRLGQIASRAALGDDLRWRIGALERAVATRQAELLPLALGRTQREPPAAIGSWRRDHATSEERAEVAVWLVAEAACELAEGGLGERLAGVGVACSTSTTSPH